MQRTTEDIRQNLDYAGFDNQTAMELCDEVDKLTEYRDHHEFVVSQIQQAIGKEIKTVGDVLDELKRLQEIGSEYNRCRDRVSEIASRESEHHAAQRREIDRLQSTLAEIEELASWHYDEDADPLEPSPEDQTAHVNGLIVRLCRKARNG